MIVYDPKALLRKIAPETKIRKLVSKGTVSLKKTALSFIDDVDFIDKKQVSRVALETLKGYRARIAAETAEKGELVDDPLQLIQRVQNNVVQQIASEIQDVYGGEYAEWTPSDAETPDPEHQLNYGKTFLISEGINGEIPGDRYGCRCGMNILVKGTQLDLS